MGVTLNETFITDHGVHVQNAYVSNTFNHISKKKQSGVNKYITSSTFSVWVSSEARDDGFATIGDIQVQVESDTPPTGNIYELLYKKLKTMKTCTDSI